MYDLTKEQGLLPEKMEFKEERQHAVLDLPGFPKKQIQKQFDSFHYNVYKMGSKKRLLKSLLYFSQIYLGHNFMAKAKNRMIVMLHHVGMKNKLMKIIQKT